MVYKKKKVDNETFKKKYVKYEKKKISRYLDANSIQNVHTYKDLAFTNRVH